MDLQRIAVCVSGTPTVVRWVKSVDQAKKSVDARVTRDGGDAVSLLAGAAADYQKGKQLQKMFDDLRSEIEAMINNAVQRIEAYIDCALEADTIGKAQASINACKTLLTEWSNNPKDTSRLDYAVTASMDAISQMQRYDWKEMEAICDGCSFRLLVLAAKFKADPSEKQNLVNFYNQAVTWHHQYVQEGIAYFQSLIDNITPIWQGNCHMGPVSSHSDGDGPTLCKYVFHDNGQEHSIDDALNGNELNAIRNGIVANRTSQRDHWAQWAQGQLDKRQAEWVKCLPK